MLDKVKEIAKRYETLGELLSDPAIVSDRAKFSSLSKERAELYEIAEKYEQYTRCEDEMKAAQAEAEGESGEMKRLFLDEARSCKERLAVLLNELKILLLPKDKNDERGCTLEIRAGAGGEEAALFA